MAWHGMAWMAVSVINEFNQQTTHNPTNTSLSTITRQTTTTTTRTDLAYQPQCISHPMATTSTVYCTFAYTVRCKSTKKPLALVSPCPVHKLHIILPYTLRIYVITQIHTTLAHTSIFHGEISFMHYTCNWANVVPILIHLKPHFGNFNFKTFCFFLLLFFIFFAFFAFCFLE